MNELVLKVDTLAKTLTKVSQENAELKENVKTPQSNWAFLTLAALLLSVVAFVLTLVRRGVKERRVRQIFGECMDSSQRLSQLHLNVEKLLSAQSSKGRTSQDVMTSVQNLDARLRTVERWYTDMITQKNAEAANTQTAARKQKAPEYHRTGYANINSGNIFTKIFDSAQEGSVFTINFKSENKGEFSIISLDKIKSRNGWRDIIEYTGSIEDATGFKVDELGICERADAEAWQITHPLKIKLLK